jgi:hypothetical protein
LNREVIAPVVLTRMEKRYHGVRVGINAGEIRAFIRVAPVTREGESIGRVGAAMLARHDVFDMKGNERRCVLGYAAILAACQDTRAELTDPS